MLPGFTTASALRTPHCLQKRVSHSLWLCGASLMENARQWGRPMMWKTLPLRELIVIATSLEEVYTTFGT